MTASRALALATFAALFAGCQDPRCSLSNCQLLLDCHSILPGATDSTCFTSAAAETFAVDAGVAGESCVSACNADGDGPLLQCVAEHFSDGSCQAIGLDGGDTTDAIETACAPFVRTTCGASCQGCEQSCGQAQEACNQGCKDAGAAPSACFACNYDCNQQATQCGANCPTD